MPLPIVFLLLFASSSALASGHCCGEVKLSQPSALVVGSGAVGSYPGQWPWLVPVFWNNSYVCGSSLISDQHLLSAAHCANTLLREDYHALVGHFDLENDTEPGSLLRKFSHFFVHPDHNQSATVFRSNADIAVLRMQQKVQFSDRVQPVCLPQPSASTSGLIGTAVGYGHHAPPRLHETRPKQVTMTSIDDRACFYIADFYHQTVSENSFCAKGGDAAPCYGDSGGGFYVFDHDTERYTTYGVVSQAARFECRPKDYTIFVDVPKYLGWINQKTCENCGNNQVCLDGSCVCGLGFESDAKGGCKPKTRLIDGEVENIECESWHQEHGVCREDEGLQTFTAAMGTEINADDFEIAPKHKSDTVKLFYMNGWSGVSARFLPIKLHLAFPNLLAIEASGLKIERITRKSLEMLPKLRYLDLAHNEISSIEENSWSDLRDLQYLNLYGNNLKWIDSNMLRGLRQLKELRITFNQISEMAEDSFADLSQLKELYIDNNELRAVGERTFAPLTSLEGIDLNHNQLTTLPDRVFESNLKLKNIVLWVNQITKLSFRLFENKPQLVFVLLRSNTCINKDYFSSADGAPPLTRKKLDELKSDLQRNCTA